MLVATFAFSGRSRSVSLLFWPRPSCTPDAVIEPMSDAPWCAVEPYLYDRMPLLLWSIWTRLLVSKLPMKPFKTGMVADL